MATTTTNILGGGSSVSQVTSSISTSSQLGKPPVTGATATTATTTTTTATKHQYTYKELENLVNKWSSELADQEKLFVQQAKKVQQWDRTLAESGDKIADIDSEVKRVKEEQKKVDSELDLIKTQQTELERMLSEMEGQISSSCSPAKVQYADQQRSQTFRMAENIDSELKGMARDLKEIIEEMNTANSNQDQSQSTFSQIVQILNAHTESLNWIDRETCLLKQKVEDVGKMAEARKKEMEPSFRALD